MKKILCIILLIFCMGSMYYFTSQDGETSYEQSHKLVEFIDKIRDKVTLKNEKLIVLKDKIIEELRGYNKDYLVRKAAHFGIYACIGAFMMLIIYLFSKKVIFSASFGFILTVIYAIYDEKRQLSISGRSSSYIDILIDSTGALIAIVLLSLILLSKKCFRFIFKYNEAEE